MAKKEPVGSVANLPAESEIEAAEASFETEIDAVFGMGDDTDEIDSAASGGEATASSAAAGAAGVEPVDGQASAPATVTPPAGEAVPGQTATGTDGTSSAPSGQQGAAAPQTPTPAAAPAPAAPVDPNLLKVNSLEATVAALRAELDALRASPPAQPAAGGQTGAQPAPSSGPSVDELPRYALTLPPQVAAAINSGDEQQTIAGITHMINSLATIVHHNVRQEMRQNIGQILQFARAHETEQAAVTQTAQLRDEYFAAFPSHKDPLILPLIQAESAAMAGEFPGLPWNENYRNALGQRVEARLAQLRGQAQPAVVTPPAAPAAMLPTGSRTEPTPGSELTGGDLIADTFS